MRLHQCGKSFCAKILSFELLVCLVSISFIIQNVFLFKWIELNVFFQVWRFLITFADVLGLWPFTLDEFIQAFHDYVSHPLALSLSFLSTFWIYCTLFFLSGIQSIICSLPRTQGYWVRYMSLFWDLSLKILKMWPEHPLRGWEQFKIVVLTLEVDIHRLLKG